MDSHLSSYEHLVNQPKEDYGYNGQATTKQEFDLSLQVENFKDLKYSYKETSDWFLEQHLLQKSINDQKKTKIVGFMEDFAHADGSRRRESGEIEEKSIKTRKQNSAYLNRGRF